MEAASVSRDSAPVLHGHNHNHILPNKLCGLEGLRMNGPPFQFLRVAIDLICLRWKVAIWMR